jgi:hypothetical protein
LTCPPLSEIIFQVLKNIPIALIAALAGFMQIEARAQTSTFEITFSNFSEGGTTVGNGLISGSLISPGVYEIVSGSFTFTSSDGLDGGTYALLPNPNPPNPSHSPSGDLLFDNLVSPAADPIVSNNGLLFGSGSVEINLYSNAGHTPEYQLFENNGVSVGGEASIVAAPEPSPLMFVLPFGAALWFLRLKRAI